MQTIKRKWQQRNIPIDMKSANNKILLSKTQKRIAAFTLHFASRQSGQLQKRRDVNPPPPLLETYGSVQMDVFASLSSGRQGPTRAAWGLFRVPRPSRSLPGRLLSSPRQPHLQYRPAGPPPCPPPPPRPPPCRPPPPRPPPPHPSAQA